MKEKKENERRDFERLPTDEPVERSYESTFLIYVKALLGFAIWFLLGFVGCMAVEASPPMAGLLNRSLTSSL